MYKDFVIYSNSRALPNIMLLLILLENKSDKTLPNKFSTARLRIESFSAQTSNLRKDTFLTQE